MITVILAGLIIGSIYGLFGVGLVVTYRGSRIINFAYAETGMIGAFVYSDLRFGTDPHAVATTDNGLWPALPVGLLVSAGLGLLTERLIVRRLRDAPQVISLVATLSLGALLLAAGDRRWGVAPRYVKPLAEGTFAKLGGLSVSAEQALVVAVTGLLLGGLALLYRYSSLGLQLRALAIDADAAGLLGINVNRVSAIVWAGAGALAGLSGILIAPLSAFNIFFMTVLFIRGLAASLVGGLTSMAGAFLAGLGIGVAEGVIGYLTPVSGVTDLSLALLVLLMMTMRPKGLVRAAY